MSDQKMPDRADLAPELLTSTEAAALIPDCQPQTLRRWARRGKVPAIILPNGRFRFRRSDIEALLQPATIAPDPPSSPELPGQDKLPW
ncbi:helix-turn-helix domain-containing protein [Actinomyces succiniciruminis]|uniref:helix-turn-helix domain-containing protein n=1 Tax=Actinomyces succiniciruminis TaxID=1522002 RepID=UPI001B335B9A|nr:helix-turn-helix domain-containing protein [Actinomyces succiniciruminis]